MSEADKKILIDAANLLEYAANLLADDVPDFKQSLEVEQKARILCERLRLLAE